VSENIQIAVIGTKLKEDAFRAVPLVDYFLHEILTLIQSKPNWPFVCLSACVTLNLQLHLTIVAHNLVQRS
jgi:hypothetical protein